MIDDFFLNAFYAGDGVMVYGEGLPPGLRLTTGQRVEYFAAGLDVVAHEMTHGVTDYTSNLVYQGESGALNESFSDMMSAGAEFFFSGTAPGTADWVLGEDVIVPGGLRSMQNPLAFGDPDHYSIRFTGPEDNGGVHINSGIPNHVFYLAIGGRHAPPVGRRGAGRRPGERRADRARDVPRLHDHAAAHRQLLDGPRGHHPVRARPLRRRQPGRARDHAGLGSGRRQLTELTS